MCDHPIGGGGEGDFEEEFPSLHLEEVDGVVGEVPVPAPMEGPVVVKWCMVDDDTHRCRFMVPHRDIGEDGFHVMCVGPPGGE